MFQSDFSGQSVFSLWHVLRNKRDKKFLLVMANDIDTLDLRLKKNSSY